MDPVLAKALKKKEQLERQLADVERFIAMHRRFSGAGKSAESPPESPNELPKVTTLRRPARPAMFVAAMEQTLKRAGDPMTRGALAEALQAAGIDIPSADPAKYLGTILWRESGKFENIEGKGYWLKGVPIPRTLEERLTLAVGAPAVGSNRT